jgi:hypothetical protein
MQYIVAMTMVAAGATAQVRLPTVPLPALTQQTLPQTLDQVQSQSLDRLSALRHLEIGRLIRGNSRVVEADPNGEPVVRNEILGLAPTDAALDHARSIGFAVDREQNIGAMNIRLVVFRAPQGMSTKKALRTLREADPGGSYDYNHIYSGGGAAGGGTLSRGGGETTDPKGRDASTSPPPAAADPAQSRVRVGLLDSGVDVTHPVFRDSAIHAWGCGSRSVPAAHGTAVASLLIGRSDVFHGVHPDAELYAADVYCGRPTGGAVDTLVAAPPLYPASYQHVVGVTAVDAHRRVLIEAARGPQVMFASPGADLAAAGSDHTYAAVRGTSFAAPFVAALLASGLRHPDSADAAAAVEQLAKIAIDLGPPGRDLTYGFGLVGADYRIDPAPLIHR